MINAPKGTKDILPQYVYKWHYIEKIIKNITSLYGLKEIRTPIFEHTELFVRGIGETTDVVGKEMYTFLDKGNRSITLKPEGTAGVARAYIENNLSAQPAPTKMYYITPVFRYEKPQSGRLRQHHQFGIEIFGSPSPLADAEVISVAYKLFATIGIKDLDLRINSIGCANCRVNYNQALKEYFSLHIDKMCATCAERLVKNPLRILDCKSTICGQYTKKAPVMLEYLCTECKEHHNKVLEALDASGISYTVDAMIVRGLDYYTKTVFEFVSTNIGSQGAVCGGGRYDNLTADLDGKPTGAVGFGLGLERLIMVAEATNIALGQEQKVSVYIASQSKAQALASFALAQSLRKKGISAECDTLNRSLKAQMKYADKQGYAYVIVLGSKEISSGQVQVKKMQDGSVTAVLTDKLAEFFKEIV